MNNSAPPQLLMIENDQRAAHDRLNALRTMPWRITHVTSPEEATPFLDSSDLLISDWKYAVSGAHPVLDPDCWEADGPPLVLTGAPANGGKLLESGAVRADDYLDAEADAERTRLTLKNALRLAELTRTLQSYRNAFDRERLGEMIGPSPAMQAVFRFIGETARSDQTILLTGEPGVGKRLCAKTIHDKSCRSSGPFVTVRCQQESPAMLAAALFGNQPQTDLSNGINLVEGAVAQADGGTLFIDQFAQLDANLQERLLGLIRWGAFRRNGYTLEERSDVRLILGESEDLIMEVSSGRLRADLVACAAPFSLRLPPLSERIEDISPLSRHFMDKAARLFDKDAVYCDPPCETALRRACWPGNVHQLKGVIQDAVANLEGTILRPEVIALSPDVAYPLASEGLGDDPHRSRMAEDDASTGADAIQPLWRLEQAAIEAAIRHCGGNIVEAAKRLGINPSTIYRKRQRGAGRKK